jgi:hypothetical protein
VVSNVEILNAGNGKKIQPIERITATSGKKFDFFEQIFGNLGRFNAPKVDP